jgi:hypothetical protein
MSKQTFSFCTNYNKAKAHKLSFSLFATKVVAPLHIVHTDLWGPSPLLSQDGNKYYVLLLMSIPDIVEFIFVHANMRYLKFLPNLSSELKPYWITK